MKPISIIAQVELSGTVSGATETSSVVRRRLLKPVASPAGNDAAGADGRASVQIGKRESGYPVAAVGRSDHREQRQIGLDRQQLAVRQRPAGGREVSGELRDLSESLVKRIKRIVVEGRGKIPFVAMI